MKIGILTFHWATNYGAILQAYALQKYLKDRGHNVEIINYKPLFYDYSIRKFLLYPRSLFSFLVRFKQVCKEIKKESRLNIFRKKYLHQTKRYYSQDEVSKIVNDYDVLISGSDQVLNPWFTMHGESKPTSVYFLQFNNNALKIGYAVSYGCTYYPDYAVPNATRWTQSFDKIGVREFTGLNILQQLGFNKEQKVVPDPTILCGRHMFEALNLRIEKKDVLYVYMLRGRAIPCDFVSSNGISIKYADSDVSHISMNRWLEDIGSSFQFITNSYHGMIMAILFHVPFVVLLETYGDIGMNDRFLTLLKRLNLVDRIADNNTLSIKSVFANNINWSSVDDALDNYRRIGEDFLSL